MCSNCVLQNSPHLAFLFPISTSTSQPLGDIGCYLSRMIKLCQKVITDHFEQTCSFNQ